MLILPSSSNGVLGLAPRNLWRHNRAALIRFSTIPGAGKWWYSRSHVLCDVCD